MTMSWINLPADSKSVLDKILRELLKTLLLKNLVLEK
jgi:hypothetical protein